MALPVATRLVVQALREESDVLIDTWQPQELVSTSRLIAEVLAGVAERLEQAGSTVHPRTPASAPDGVTVSSDAPEPAQPDKDHPGPVVKVTHPGPVHATLVELRRQLNDIGVTTVYPRIGQLLDDAIKLSSDC